MVIKGLRSCHIDDWGTENGSPTGGLSRSSAFEDPRTDEFVANEPAAPGARARKPLRRDDDTAAMGYSPHCATVWPQIAAIHSQDFPTTTERESADEDLTDCLFAFGHSQYQDLVTSAERDVASGEDDLAIAHYRNDRGLSRKTEIRDRDAVGRR